MPSEQSSPLVAVVGGGLAGMAAAMALVERGVRVELFEARRQLGGRAASFRDPTTGELVDYCQHVSLGCCTNLADFCRRLSVSDRFIWLERLHFFTAQGDRYDFLPTRWLPTPLHLLAPLWNLKYLSVSQRLHILRTLVKLARWQAHDGKVPTVETWLRAQGHTASTLDGFWSVILNSALGETIDRASLRGAQQVFVDGFMRHGDSYKVAVPIEPLSDLFGQRAQHWLGERGARVCLGQAVDAIDVDGQGQFTLRNVHDSPRYAGVVAAVTWRHIESLVGHLLPELSSIRQLESAPITGVHLWFDRPIMSLDHAVLVGTLSQWVFHHAGPTHEQTGHYYQVVISASHMLAKLTRDEVVQRVVDELQRIWPKVGEARLLAARVVTDPHAVFSPRVETEGLRPVQQSSLRGLALAGDWTATCWPATMEGAVRSGYLAAEAILRSLGQQAQVLVEPLKAGGLSRLLRLVRDQSC